MTKVTLSKEISGLEIQMKSTNNSVSPHLEKMRSFSKKPLLRVGFFIVAVIAIAGLEPASASSRGQDCDIANGTPLSGLTADCPDIPCDTKDIDAGPGVVWQSTKSEAHTGFIQASCIGPEGSPLQCCVKNSPCASKFTFDAENCDTKDENTTLTYWRVATCTHLEGCE